MSKDTLIVRQIRTAVVDLCVTKGFGNHREIRAILGDVLGGVSKMSVAGVKAANSKMQKVPYIKIPR